MFDQLSDKLHGAFAHLRGKAQITESNIEQTLSEVKTALLEADVNFRVVKDFTVKVKDKALGEKVLRGVDPGQQFVKIMHDELAAMMGGEKTEIQFSKKPQVILVVGLNGQGKTTFCGKLGLYLKSKQNKKSLLVPADTFRPAAKKQLQTLASQVAVDCFDSDLSLAPEALALAGLKHAQDNDYDVVIIDTAGRLHVDDELMAQIVRVKESLKNENPEVMMLADAMSGQQAVEVSKTFHEKVGLTGLILSKMDSDARGGAALSIKYATGVPLLFLSTGEKMSDLEIFHPDRLAKRILDMGDVLGLVEKAQDAIEEKEAERMMKNLERQKFTIDDFIKQLDMMSKMGPLSGLMKMIPGMGGVMREVGDLSGAESELKLMKIMASSMTQSERENYKIINDSRTKRIARGSGRSERDVKDFLKKFAQMEKMMVGMMQMMKGGGMGALGGMGGFPGMPGAGQAARPGFRQAPGTKSSKMKNGKRKSPWGGGFF